MSWKPEPGPMLTKAQIDALVIDGDGHDEDVIALFAHARESLTVLVEVREIAKRIDGQEGAELRDILVTPREQLAAAESHADDLNVLVLEQADKITLLRAVARRQSDGARIFPAGCWRTSAPSLIPPSMAPCHTKAT
jgi:hypothetical protein